MTRSITISNCLLAPKVWNSYQVINWTHVIGWLVNAAGQLFVQARLWDVTFTKFTPKSPSVKFTMAFFIGSYWLFHVYSHPFSRLVIFIMLLLLGSECFYEQRFQGESVSEQYSDKLANYLHDSFESGMLVIPKLYIKVSPYFCLLLYILCIHQIYNHQWLYVSCICSIFDIYCLISLCIHYVYIRNLYIGDCTVNVYNEYTNC